MTARQKPTAAASKRSARTTQLILDAAIRCYARLGVEKSTIVDIAAEADIGRTTLYRHFKDRDEILVQAMVRDIEHIFDRLGECIDRQHTLEDKIIEGFLFCLDEFKRRPVLGLMFSQDSATLLNHLGLHAEALNATGLALTRPIYEQAKAQARLREGVELGEFVEWITRILLSLQLTPSEHLAEQISSRQFLRRFLIPSLLIDHQAEPAS